MAAKSLVWQWAHRGTLAPALVTAAEIQGPFPRICSRIRNPHWILDYEFQSYGAYRVRTESAPWRPRLPRTAHLYPPGATYWEDTRTKPGQRHSAWIGIAQGEAAGLERLIHPAHGYARFLDTDGSLGARLQQILRMGQRQGEGGFWQAQAALCEILAALFAAPLVEAETRRVGAEGEPLTGLSFTGAVENFLRTRLSEGATLPEIARHLHVSRSTVAHRYRREAGETPMTTLTRLRLNHAKALLLRGEPLKSIAARLGFADEFHLSRAFKRVEGVCPRDFRRGKGTSGK